jgi:anti-sigma regulatory factor (Ser/Thr protein kinase)
MGGDGAPDRFLLTVPAHAGLVGTLRVFASAVARHYGLEDDLVEDVKLAVSEASTDPVDAGVSGDISLSIVRDDDGLECSITSAGWSPTTAIRAAGDLPEGIDPAALDRLQLVSALFPDARRVDRGDQMDVRFSTASRDRA